MPAAPLTLEMVLTYLKIPWVPSFVASWPDELSPFAHHCALGVDDGLRQFAATGRAGRIGRTTNAGSPTGCAASR